MVLKSTSLPPPLLPRSEFSARKVVDCSFILNRGWWGPCGNGWRCYICPPECTLTHEDWCTNSYLLEYCNYTNDLPMTFIAWKTYNNFIVLAHLRKDILPLILSFFFSLCASFLAWYSPRKKPVSRRSTFFSSNYGNHGPLRSSW